MRFLKYQCGIRKSFSTQNPLLSLEEKMLLPIDKKELCGALLADV